MVVAATASGITTVGVAAQVPASTAGDRGAGSVPLPRRDLQPGTLVRVTDRTGGQTSGRVWSVTTDSLHLGLESHGFAAFAWSDVRGYEVARGRARGHGAVRGALVGGALGAALIVVGAYADAKDGGEVLLPSYVVTVPATVLLSGLGAGIGAIVAPTRWGDRVIVQRQSTSTGVVRGPATADMRSSAWRLGWRALF